MSSAFRGLAKELTGALNRELSTQEPAPIAASSELFDLLVSVLADRVAPELQRQQNGDDPANPEALLKLVRRIRNEAQSCRPRHRDEQAEDSAAADSRFDIREKSPKFANIESLLRYDDTPDPRHGIKVVFMNFND